MVVAEPRVGGRGGTLATQNEKREKRGERAPVREEEGDRPV